MKLIIDSIYFFLIHSEYAEIGSRVNLRNSWLLNRKSSSLFTRKLKNQNKNNKHMTYPDII